VVDWIASYWERVESLPVLSRAEPGALAAALPAAPPEEGEPWDEILADLDRLILPGVTHWQAPGFFAYFPCNASPPAVLGELLSAGLGVQGMLWTTSPAATELETRMLEWLARALDLPREFEGCIQGTASESTLVAMIAARHRLRGHDAPLVAYTSTEGHSSVQKAANIAGHPLRLLDVGADRTLDPQALAAALREDRAAGRIPFFLCATVGTTSTGAVDPLPEIGAVLQAERFPGWLHVDAAWAGSACVCPEHRDLLAGIERADSLCFNPHKWLLTNFDCSAFWTRDRATLTDALSVTPEYLRNRASESGAVIDYRDWQIPLGRRFRALKLWLVLRHYGLAGLREHIRGHVRLAETFAGWVESDDRFELCAPRRLSLVCFRRRGSDDENRALLDRVNASGRAFLSHTTVDGRFALRLAVGGTRTGKRHVETAWELLSAD
jgi:aromatic-L-amino-acid decarboxylase